MSAGLDSMSVDALLDAHVDGDAIGWDAQFDWLMEHHRGKVLDLVRDIRENGIREPIVIGNDGRIWDGHHRLLAARLLQLPTVPVKRIEATG